ncbi:MAG: Hypoxanthine-guanine phosphoribosyltransferase (EC [uncultured Caballeronia sp.]|nr:MAG: Hypoxanthine-guanine phosphoribosyltransferase (EC [uncultured Caballeronia sp.]
MTALIENMAKAIGTAVFSGMLLPHLDFPLEFDYIHLTRYRNTTKGGDKMEWRVAPAESVKDCVVLDDILDEGETMAAIRDRIMARGAKKFLSTVLCKKLINKSKPLRPDFCGFEVPDRYVLATAWTRRDTGATCRLSVR